MTDSSVPHSSQPTEPTASRLGAENRAPLVLPVVEEQVVIGREVIENGRVRIRKVVTEQPQAVEVMLQRDEVQVERIAINQFVADDAPLPESRQQGDTLIIPVLREVVVTRVLLVEELHIRKQVIEDAHHSTVQLRREQIEIERDTLSDNSLSK